MKLWPTLLMLLMASPSAKAINRSDSIPKLTYLNCGIDFNLNMNFGIGARVSYSMERGYEKRWAWRKGLSVAFGGTNVGYDGLTPPMYNPYEWNFNLISTFAYVNTNPLSRLEAGFNMACGVGYNIEYDYIGNRTNYLFPAVGLGFHIGTGKLFRKIQIRWHAGVFFSSYNQFLDTGIRIGTRW